MLEQFTFTGRELLLAVVLASVVYLVEWLLFTRKKGRSAPFRAKDLAAIVSRLEDIEKRLTELESQSPALLDGHAGTYADALRLAGEGLSAVEVAQRLGISIGEAELITALRRAQS